MRIVFMGTPDFAVGSLQALCESGKHEILAVVTQPDRPKGRGNKLLQTPVKEYALEQGLTVYQPQKVKTPEFVELLHELQPELIVVAAFGQFLSKEILELPKYGCINLHVSLLPKYRGAAPIQYAIIKGEKESGVTIMQMDIGMDTGAMLDKVVVPIAENTTMGELHDLCVSKVRRCCCRLSTRLRQVPLWQNRRITSRLPMRLFWTAAWSISTGAKLRRRYTTLSVALTLHPAPLPSCRTARA